MNPLFKVVAITLLTAHPDKFKQCLNVGASTNVKPPAGISLIQLIRAVEQRGADLLRQLIIQEELQQKQQNASTNADSANNQNKNNNGNGNNNNNFDADDGELMNADVGGNNNNNNDDDSDDEHERRAAQQTGRIARFKQVWPQDVLPQVWVPDVVRQLISMGAVVNENAAIENRRPHLRLTQAAFNAAFNELAGMRLENGANSIVPTELQRRKNKNKYERVKRQNTQKKKAKRAGEKKAAIMEKKLNKVRGKVMASKNKKKKKISRAGKKRS